MQNHKVFLLQALTCAKNREGFCAPNPAVGAVVVKDNQVIATGYHLGAGFPHAEVEALDKAGDNALGATLYITLEPCCHFGRTPPCTDRILKAGIKAVYFGFTDPNPVVSGKSAAILNQAGIACKQVSLPEIDLFYTPYAYWTKNKKPFVTAKLAISADFKIAGENKQTVRITGAECEKLTHEYRKKSDAILTGINTIVLDNPNLNCRLNNEIISKPIYILDSHAKLPLDFKIWKTAKSITVFYSQNAEKSAIEKLTQQGANCILVSENKFGLDLAIILKQIGADGFQTLLIEAGAICFNSFLKQNLLNQVLIYISPTLLGEKAYSARIDLNLIEKNFKLINKKIVGNDQVFFYCSNY